MNIRALLHRGGSIALGRWMLIPGLIPITPAIIAKDSEPVNPVRDLQDRHTRDLSCQTVVAFIVAATCRSSAYASRSPFREKKKGKRGHRVLPHDQPAVTTIRSVLGGDLKILINSRTRISLPSNEFPRWIDGGDGGDDGK